MATQTNCENVFKDVNTETYLKSLFVDSMKHEHIKSLPERAQIIHDFMLTNPTNSSNKINKYGLITRDGYILIKKRIKNKK